MTPPITPPASRPTTPVHADHATPADAFALSSTIGGAALIAPSLPFPQGALRDLPTDAPGTAFRDTYLGLSRRGRGSGEMRESPTW